MHDLRHTHASWLIAAGVPLTVIRRLLGHESIKATSDTYGHLADDADQAAATALD
ncbi:tyrosine-type recombinase/integrase [Kocuria rhizophila]|uniref:tyrosine-type recombinase/integrase n=1 Tax=Kocuria rhizophila TaxID=72000 RepID=UPI000AD00375|nr:tyrosine-type recombinase/integrase [Kocuria rhizophila]